MPLPLSREDTLRYLIQRVEGACALAEREGQASALVTAVTRLADLVEQLHAEETKKSAKAESGESARERLIKLFDKLAEREAAPMPGEVLPPAPGRVEVTRAPARELEAAANPTPANDGDVARVARGNRRGNGQPINGGQWETSAPDVDPLRDWL